LNAPHNQQVLCNYKKIAQITPCRQAPYKTLVNADWFKSQVYLMSDRIFLA